MSKTPIATLTREGLYAQIWKTPIRHRLRSLAVGLEQEWGQVHRNSAPANCIVALHTSAEKHCQCLRKYSVGKELQIGTVS